MAERRDDFTTGGDAGALGAGATPYGGTRSGGETGATGMTRPTGAAATPATTNSRDTEDPAAIRADIRETRVRLGDTLEEIGDRLNPKHLTEQVKDNLKEATIGRARHVARGAADRVNETRYSIMDTIRDNPIPAAMIGIGLAWLMINRRRENTAGATYYGASTGADTYRGTTATTDAYGADTGYAYAGAPYGGAAYPAGSYAAADLDDDSEEGRMARARERAGQVGHDVKERAGNVANRARETAGSVADRTKHAASNVADRTKHVASNVADRSRMQARRAENSFYEQPLAVGAATIALGLAAGMAIPVSDREVRIMGDARDRLVDRAKEKAHDARERVETVVERVAEDAKDSARQAARDEGLTSNA